MESETLLLAQVERQRSPREGSSEAPDVRYHLLVRSIRNHHHDNHTAAHDIERKNWLIHLHYIKKDFETCKVCTAHTPLARPTDPLSSSDE